MMVQSDLGTLLGIGLLDLGPQMSFIGPGAWTAYAQVGELSYSYTYYRRWIPAPSNQKGWPENLKAL